MGQVQGLHARVPGPPPRTSLGKPGAALPPGARPGACLGSTPDQAAGPLLFLARHGTCMT